MEMGEEENESALSRHFVIFLGQDVMTIDQGHNVFATTKASSIDCYPVARGFKLEGRDLP